MAASSGFLKIVTTWLPFQGISVQSLIHGDNTFVTCMKDLNNMVFLTDLIFWNKETTSKTFGTSLKWTINHSYKMYVIINFVKLSKWITSFIVYKPSPLWVS